MQYLILILICWLIYLFTDRQQQIKIVSVLALIISLWAFGKFYH